MSLEDEQPQVHLDHSWRPKCEALEHPLRIARIAKELKASVTHDLIKALFFHSERRKFFAFIETEEEITLIFEEEMNSIFSSKLKLDSNTWRAIQVSAIEWEMQQAKYNLVNCVSTALAKEDISIFYVSASSVDFVLVPERNVERSLRVLGDAFESLTKDAKVVHDHLQQKVEVTKETQKKHLLVMSEAVHSFSLPKEHLKKDTFSLLQLFFGDRKERFVAYVETSEELSFIVDNNSFELLNACAFSEEWKCFQMCDWIDTANAMPGIVASLSVALCAIQDRILCLSSYSTDFIFVKQVELMAALHCLQSNFVILTEESDQ